MILFVNYAVLTLLLVLAVWFDIKERRIPNSLTFPAILWGVLFSGISGGFEGILFSLNGFLVGMAIFFIPFATGGMGAGDVKLMAAIGASMGWMFTLQTAMATAIAGGLMALVFLLINGGLRNSLKKVVGIVLKPLLYMLYWRTKNIRILTIIEFFSIHQNNEKKVYIPYAVAIGMGTLFVLVTDLTGKTFF